MTAKQVIASPIQVNQKMLAKHQGQLQGCIGAITSAPVDGQKAQQALSQLVERLEILRTTITQDGHGVYWQQVHEQMSVGLHQLDWQDLHDEPLLAAQAELNQSVVDGRDGPWLNLTIATLADGKAYVHIAMPSINSDNYSLTRLLAFVLDDKVQSAVLSEDEDELVQYEDLAEWLNSFLVEDELEQARQYWHTDSLNSGFNDNFALSRYRNDEYAKGYASEQISLGATYASIATKATQLGASTADVIAASLSLSLAKISGSVSLSRVLDSRNDEDLETAIGPLSRALPIFTNPQDKFDEAVKAQALACEQAIDYIECFARPSQFEQQAFPFVFAHMKPTLVDSAKVVNCICPTEPSRVSFNFVEQGADSLLTVDYDKDYIDGAVISDWLERWHEQLQGDLAGQSQAVMTLEQQPQAVDYSAMMGFNNVVSWFEHMASSALTAKVINPDGSAIDLASLNKKANQLANYLTAKGIGKGAQVAIRLEQSADFILAMLAVVKAGAAYIPIDVQLPDTRVQSMLSGAGVKMLISQATDEPSTVDASTDNGSEVELCLFASVPWQELSEKPPGVEISQDDIAYVLFTSGSTGKAKGVKVPHKAIFNHMAWMQQTFDYKAQDVFLQRTSVSFDASVWECWSPLLAGATMVVVNKDANYDLAAMVAAIKDNKVSVLQMVPSQLEVLLEQTGVDAVDSLRVVFCGGEALKTSVAESAKQAFACEVVNLYGPSECCIDATYLTYQSGLRTDYVPIGQGITNVQHLVVKDDGSRALSGEEGELWLTGQCLFSGYQDQDDLTAQATGYFADDKQRFYKTGDFVRILADGNLYFLERLDNQVKLNGFRIELDEISTLVEHHNMAAQAVCVCDKKTVTLSLFVRGVADGSDEDAIRKLLAAHLPEYMVPDLILPLDEFPRLSNGKVDVKSLQAMAADKRQVPYTPPSNETEQQLADIWQDCLGLEEPVGVNSDFFAIGGHSLIAIKVISRIVDKFAIKVTVHDLFENSTIAGLAQRMETLSEQGAGTALQEQEIVALDDLSDDDSEEFEL